MERLYRIDQLQLVCDHQGLAYTPRDRPRRVGMTRVNPITIYETFGLGSLTVFLRATENKNLLKSKNTSFV